MLPFISWDSPFKTQFDCNKGINLMINSWKNFHLLIIFLCYWEQISFGKLYSSRAEFWLAVVETACWDLVTSLKVFGLETEGVQRAKLIVLCLPYILVIYFILALHANHVLHYFTLSRSCEKFYNYILYCVTTYAVVCMLNQPVHW
jgi:hypothetical protein